MDEKRTAELQDFDRKHLWHPYTSMTAPLSSYPVESAEGCRLKLCDGRELVDGMASWWSAVHGYSHPGLVKAVQEQAARMSHVMFGGLTHQPAVELGRRLIELTPEPLQHVFLADSGSVAVEAAMKMAIQYQSARGASRRRRFLSLSGGYHGDTWHAMSVCDPVNGMHQLYGDALPSQIFAPVPSCRFDDEWDPLSAQETLRLIELHRDEVAGVILEPVVQGAGGMHFYHPQLLKEIRKACTEYDILLIADEIATGFGRTGRLFACEWGPVVPDILCLGKALTGGMMTLSAVVATSVVAQGVSRGGLPFMHGPTFMGNPLACAAACESIDLLLEADWRGAVRSIERQLDDELEVARGLEAVVDVRVLGAIGVVELNRPVNMEKITQFYLENGVWIRPFGKLVYLMPPFNIQSDELTRLTSVLVDSVSRPELLQEAAI